MKKVACVIALAGTTLSGVALTPAIASPENATANGLRISIPNAKIVTNEFTTTVDMQFRGGDIRSVELFVDGSLLKKQDLNTDSGRGIVSFALDGLADGTHSVLVRAQDLAGNWIVTSAKFKVAPAPESALARAVYPLRGQMVQGVVPIKVELSDSIRNPYVSFSIDDEFMAIMNGAPYSYGWDSSKASNGLHTITADIFDDVAKIKTLKIQINVNNAGGFTNIQRDPVAQKEAVAPAAPAKNADAVRETLAKFSSPTSGLHLEGTLGALANAATELTSESAMRVGKAPAARKFALPKSGFAARPDVHPLTNAAPLRLANSAPGVIGAFSNPVSIVRLMDSNADNVARLPLALRNATNIAYRPGDSRLKLTAIRGLRGSSAVNAVKRGAFAVFFDNSLITFDAPTRVENGIAMAPFRHLFEYTGGTIVWESATQTVTASKPGQEIKFVIGDKEARVNDKPLAMDAAPFLDAGRSIVPLSFIGNVLNVAVSYDKATGRVLIESKKFVNH